MAERFPTMPDIKKRQREKVKKWIQKDPTGIGCSITRTQICNPRIERKEWVQEIHADTQSQTHKHTHSHSETPSEKWESWRRRIIARLVCF